MKAILALADGQYFEGLALGASGEACGEVVFNTSMTGYQEILTDPSYEGQLVAMTYPQIGNVGVNPEDVESRRPFMRGFIVKDYTSAPSNWRAAEPLHEYMKRHGIVGIQGIDTRALVRHLRDHGAQDGIISTSGASADDLIAKAKNLPGLVGVDLVKNVSCADAYDWHEGLWQLAGGYKRREANGQKSQKRISREARLARQRFLSWLMTTASSSTSCVIWPTRDAGSKWCRRRRPQKMCSRSIPTEFFFPTARAIPMRVPYARENVRKLIGKKPIFGICLGHQIMGLALGGKTYKLKFGHHGGNQPVMDLTTRKVEITSQNHGFAVDAESLKGAVELTHVNLNDNTVEGLAHRELPIFSVQYHPEASPGPHDANYLFKRFTDLMAEHRGR